MVDIRIKDLADGSAQLDDTDLLAFDSGADGTRRISLSGLRSTMLANGATLVEGAEWILTAAAPAAIGGAGRDLTIQGGPGAAGNGGTVSGAGGIVRIRAGDTGADGGAGEGVAGVVWIGDFNTGAVIIGPPVGTAPSPSTFSVQKWTAVAISGSTVTLIGGQASADAVVIEAGNSLGSVRVNVASSKKLEVTGTQVLVPIGSSTVPGLSFIGDTDTGFSCYTANSISFILQAVEWIQISGPGIYGQQSSGISINAGITDSPVYINGRKGSGTSVPSVSITNGGVSMNASSGVQVLLGVATTLNQTSTAGFTALDIDVTETAIGSGTHRLINAKIGGTSRLEVLRTGKLITTPQLVVATGDEVGVDIAQTVNKATSGNYTGIKLNVTETSAPGTDDRLLDLQVGGTSMARVSNEGVIRGAEVQSVLFIEKTANESVLNNTFQNDDELTCSLKASAKYYFRIHLFINNAGATANFKIQMNGSVGVSSIKGHVRYFTTTPNIAGRFTALAGAVFATFGAGDQYATVEGTIETSTAGTFTLQWAQGTTDGANATQVQRNSSMLVHRIG